MTRTTHKKAKHQGGHLTSSRAPNTEKLYEMLSVTSALDDDIRNDWLSRYEKLPTHAQMELFRDLISIEKELEKEEEAHLQRLAEITGKYEVRLKHFARAHRLYDLTPSEPTQSSKTAADVVDELLDEEFIQQLNQVDNY